MSWQAYNEIIDAIMDRENLSYQDARELYSELREQGYSTDDIREMYDAEDYDELDDWIEDFDDGRFDDDPPDEVAGGVDTGKRGK